MKHGDIVNVMPTDNGELIKNFAGSMSYLFSAIARIPTIGRLIALSREEIVVEVTSGSAGAVRCHFPRLEFSVKQDKAKL